MGVVEFRHEADDIGRAVLERTRGIDGSLELEQRVQHELPTLTRSAITQPAAVRPRPATTAPAEPRALP